MMQGRRVRRRRKPVLRALWELVLLAAVLYAGYRLARYGVRRYYYSAYPIRYEQAIDRACAENRLDRALVYAVVRTESGFDPQALSNVGARGLMQLMPDTYDWVRMRYGEEPSGDYEALFDPQTSITYGTRLLRLLLDEFGTVENTLCAYHGGWGSVKEWLATPEYAPDGEHVTNIPFADTRAYVKKVGETMEIYRRLYGF